MLYFPHINPVAFQLGPISVYWYGFCYLFGFGLGYFVLLKRAKHQSIPWKHSEVGDFIFYIAIGVIFGGTIGFVVFYQPSLILETPWRLLQFWEGGRSFHGGLLGVVLAMWLFSKLHHRKFLEVSDFMIVAVPIGIACGRVGNFINGELWGRVTEQPWGMIFHFVDLQPRHPSQLYEGFLEGILLFVILWIYSRHPRKLGMVSAWFLILYGVFRFLVEFFREPDFDQGYILLNWVTKGQLLSFPMILIGVGLIVLIKLANRKK